MSFPSLTFSENSSVAELVVASGQGLLFFQSHNHQGSYQLLTRSMKELHQSGVRHFYLELPNFLNQEFKTHRKKNSTPFQTSLINLQDKLVQSEIKALVEAAHQAGIKIIAVDGNDNLNTGTQIGKSEDSKKVLAKRLTNDNQIIKNIQYFVGKLSTQEKFSGLFGSNHSLVCQKLAIPSVLIVEHNQLPDFTSHINYLPESIMGANEQTNQHLKQFNVITLVPSNLDQDKIDFTQEVTTLSNLKYLNQLLQSYELTSCRAYRHIASEKIDAVMEFPLNEKESANRAWEKICAEMDPLPKFMVFESDAIRIVFKNLETTAVLRLIVAALVELKKKTNT